MKGKKILIGISGSIAAYKIPELVRQCIKSGAEVQVMMTPTAADFVSPLVLSTLSKNKVLIEMFDEDTWSNHVMLGRWADLLVIAPASCNTLAKMANGQCDNFLLATYMSATCPVLIVPAMDEDMWHHPATQSNLNRLKSFGHQVLDTSYGELASGLIGQGRMAEPNEICEAIQTKLKEKTSKLSGKQILITAGPTYENIDPVRFIGNHSTGKMGIAIADQLASLGANVTLVLGPTELAPKQESVKTIKVISAQEMYDACVVAFPNCDAAIMSAAVADYTPITVATDKIKKKDSNLQIELTKTKDILKALGASKKEHQVLIGFALETTNEKEYSLKKLKDKNADMIVLNSVRDAGAGFGYDTNKVTFYKKDGSEIEHSLKSKVEVAKDIINELEMMLS